MIRANFLSPEQRAELEQIIRRPSEDHGVARRANAILLLDDGWSCAQVGKAFYLDDDTIRNWHCHFQSGGLDRLGFECRRPKALPRVADATEQRHARICHP